MALAGLRKTREKNIEYFNKRLNVRRESLKARDLVLLYNSKTENDLSGKLDPFYTGPYRVMRDLGNGTYVVADLDGATFKNPITGNRLKLYIQRDGSMLKAREEKSRGRYVKDSSSEDSSEESWDEADMDVDLPASADRPIVNREIPVAQALPGRLTDSVIDSEEESGDSDFDVNARIPSARPQSTAALPGDDIFRGTDAGLDGGYWGATGIRRRERFVQGTNDDFLRRV